MLFKRHLGDLLDHSCSICLILARHWKRLGLELVQTRSNLTCWAMSNLAWDLYYNVVAKFLVTSNFQNYELNQTSSNIGTNSIIYNIIKLSLPLSENSEPYLFPFVGGHFIVSPFYLLQVKRPSLMRGIPSFVEVNGGIRLFSSLQMMELQWKIITLHTVIYHCLCSLFYFIPHRSVRRMKHSL